MTKALIILIAISGCYPYDLTPADTIDAKWSHVPVTVYPGQQLDGPVSEAYTGAINRINGDICPLLDVALYDGDIALYQHADCMSAHATWIANQYEITSGDAAIPVASCGLSKKMMLDFATHELLHTFGIVHSENDKCLMSPYYHGYEVLCQETIDRLISTYCDYM